MIKELCVVGYPADIGGANTELWHTVKLWRQNGLGVTLYAINGAADHWRARVEAIGCRTVKTSRRNLAAVLPHGATVVAFCHQPFLSAVEDIKNACHARVIYAPCMTYLFAEDRGLCDQYVFQSRYQMGVLGPKLRALGVSEDRLCLVGGAFDATEFSYRFRPRKPGQPFVAGRLSRPDVHKFRPDLWRVLGDVPNVRARVMGWSDSIAGKCGPPPAWAEVLPKLSEPPGEFLHSLHCMLQDGDDKENWPRTALEAMASGVPIVAPDRGGWPEMIRHGVTGLLARDSADLAAQAARLEANDELRAFIARHAREAVQRPLCDPRLCWRRWKALLE